MTMTDMDEIRARYSHATDSPEAAARFTANAYGDMGTVMWEIHQMKKDCEDLRLDYVDLLDRAEKAETELSAYKQALQNWNEEDV